MNESMTRDQAATIVSLLKMKNMETETMIGCARSTVATLAPLPPPSPPLFWAARRITVSVTNQEIAKYWRKKKVEEEDHLLAAIKAAARIRARNLTDDDYRCFEESLTKDDESGAHDAALRNSSNYDERISELRVGIKDWWTKSKYAYLNQPAILSTDSAKKRSSTYVPNLCSYKLAPPPTTSFHIF